jgi:flagellar export protein FliJ
MKSDVRGFSYSLEPVRRKYQWQLDILHGKLGRKQKEIDEQETMIATLNAEYQAVAKKSAEALLLKVDPSIHQHVLGYLSQLNARIESNQDDLKTLFEQRNVLREACLNQQKKLELTEQHRASCLKEFSAAEQSRQNTEADRDWNAREFWRVRTLVHRSNPRESHRKGSV